MPRVACPPAPHCSTRHHIVRLSLVLVVLWATTTLSACSSVDGVLGPDTWQRSGDGPMVSDLEHIGVGTSAPRQRRR